MVTRIELHTWIIVLKIEGQEALAPFTCST